MEEIRLWPWAMISAAISALILLIAVTVQMVKPATRLRRLKKPCRAYFHIREFQIGELDYVFQNDHAHNLKELVLPANVEVEIEVAYVPTIRFSVEATVFGVDGDADAKPLPIARISRFIAEAKGKTRWKPGEDVTDQIDRHGNYHHRSTTKPRAVGTCYTTGYVLRTQKPGVYRAWLGFITDEVDAEAELSIRVEDKPQTRMQCTAPGHRQCYLRPMGKAWRSTQ